MMDEYSLKEFYTARLKPVLEKFEQQKKEILWKVYAAKILGIVLVFAVTSLFLGFLHVFPFAEFEIVGIVFKSFFYLVLILITFTFSHQTVKYLIKLKSPILLKNSRLLQSYASIITIVILVSAYLTGTFFFGTISGVFIFVRYAIFFLLIIVLAIPMYFFNKAEKNFYSKYKTEVLPVVYQFVNPLIPVLCAP